MIDEKKLLEFIKANSYPVRQFDNSIEKGMTLSGIEQAINELSEDNSLADYARNVIKVNIPCIINGKETTITEVFNHPCSGLRCMANGEEYSLSAVCDKTGKPVIRYTIDDKWYFEEWFLCIKKEATTGKKEYCFTEVGQEYWFTTTDFKRHYTALEG